MKVCTFLGDPFRIYDEVTQRIEEALEEILAAHGEMELYFPGWFGEFPRACAAAALRVKGRHPDRIVALTLAVSAQWQEDPAACCVFDRIIRIPVLENSPDMGRHRLLQAILRRCDCLISYVYLELRGEEAQILSSVRRRRRLTVLDVTDPDTAAYLKEHIRALPREERLVFQAGDRVQRRAVSEELGISTASLSKMAYKTRVALLKQLIARYEMMRREGALPLVVGLMHLKAGPDVVFEVIDRFLALLQMICFRHNVRFLVDEATCAPVFPALLRYLAQNGRGETWMELVTPRGDVERRYAAAFHQVIHGESQAVAEIEGENEMKDEKAEVYIRVLDDNHRVCIPIQVRQEMEVSPGCSIEFLADGDRIILRKYGQEVSSIFWTVCGKFMNFRGNRSAPPAGTG